VRLHNDRPRQGLGQRSTLRAALCAVLLCAALAATGCSLADSSDADTSPSSSGTAGSTSATPYLPVPSDVQLTEPGSRLAVGDHAVVAYRPRQGDVAALDIAVTRLQRASTKDFSAWHLSSQQQRSTPYYVHARVENVGETDLGGDRVPLYVVNDDNVLLLATPFASSFQPCPSAPLPDTFRPGDKTDACLVYFAPDHGDLVAVSFRPEETFDPITWTGPVEKEHHGG
jgi:hypothetical protein